jgi:hypothetical protein
MKNFQLTNVLRNCDPGGGGKFTGKGSFRLDRKGNMNCRVKPGNHASARAAQRQAAKKSARDPERAILNVDGHVHRSVPDIDIAVAVSEYDDTSTKLHRCARAIATDTHWAAAADLVEFECAELAHEVRSASLHGRSPELTIPQVKLSAKAPGNRMNKFQNEVSSPQL